MATYRRRRVWKRDRTGPFDQPGRADALLALAESPYPLGVVELRARLGRSDHMAASARLDLEEAGLIVSMGLTRQRKMRLTPKGARAAALLLALEKVLHEEDAPPHG